MTSLSIDVIDPNAGGSDTTGGTSSSDSEEASEVFFQHQE